MVEKIRERAYEDDIDFKGGSDISVQTEGMEVKPDIWMWIKGEIKEQTSDGSIFQERKKGKILSNLHEKGRDKG